MNGTGQGVRRATLNEAVRGGLRKGELKQEGERWEGTTQVKSCTGAFQEVGRKHVQRS